MESIGIFWIFSNLSSSLSIIFHFLIFTTIFSPETQFIVMAHLRQLEVTLLELQRITALYGLRSIGAKP